MTTKAAHGILTFSGLLFDATDPSPHDICLLDIEASLAKTNRFGGHTKAPYSVAQHCVLMSSRVPKEDRLWALLHDATEAYIGDLPKPIKNALPAFEDMEERIMMVIARKYDLPWPMPQSVKDADIRMLLTEARDLFDDHPGFTPWREGFEPYEMTIHPWDWKTAQDRWSRAVAYAMFGRATSSVVVPPPDAAWRSQRP